MSALRTIIGELWGLFVDDGRFALSILVWLAIGWSLPKFAMPPALACVVFAVGFAFLLVESALRRARKD